MGFTKPKWEQKKNKEALNFFKEFIQKVLKGKFQVVHFGFWSCGQKGKYGVSLYFNNMDELTESPE